MILDSLFLIPVFIFGAAIGSFLNVVILRLHEGKSLGGRSHCPYCQHQLSTIDLIPILSYLLQSGKCRYCQHNLSLQYPLVELITALTLTLALLNQESSITSQANLIFLILNSCLILFTISTLIVVSVYDLRWGLIPDKVILPASGIVFTLSTLLFLISSTQGFLYYLYCLLTVIGIGLFFLLLILITRGRGMGGGDLKLAVFIALALGFPNAILAILLGFLTGAIGSVILLLVGRKSLKSTIPFGPFLALGAYLALLFGNYIWTAYLKALGF